MRAALPLALALAACTGAGDAMPPGTTAGDCGSCHTEQHAEWSTSRHASSATSPVFEAMLPRVEAAWGPSARAACVSCHSPGHGGDDAIGCVSCHAAVGNTAEHGGRLLVDLDRPVAGPTGATAPGSPHASRRGDFLTSPSLCGTCHEVVGPGLFDEPTLAEYRASGLPAIGATCVSCHMPDVETPTGPPRRSHRLAGVDPPWGASPRAAAEAAERTRALLADALALWIEPHAGGATVIVENAGAGHAVPTGVSFLRDVWIDGRAVDANGVETHHRRALSLGAQLLHEDREVALITDADRVEPRGLALGEHASVEIALPAGAARPVLVEATLRARAIREDVLTALELTDRSPEIPELVVHTAGVRVP